MYEDIKQKAYEANMLLHKYGIAPFTWGNASECDREKKVFAIKPSGVPYEELSPEQMVIVDFNGNKVEGGLSPSSDTATHAVLYSVFPDIGGVVHTHSVNAVAFAQAGAPIPALGTTHADFCYGFVPCTRELSKAEVEGEYEKNTGLVIAEYFKNTATDENAVPAVLVKSHGPFSWGKDAKTAAYNAAVLEIVAEMAIKTASLGKDDSPIPQHLLDKHYLRKHGKNAYYGQKKN
ncbi:MAG: L-ribulose-5-phosphate 4-epimerase [Oscillospiraceae bacterium]|nr:L-ribulose-5-phosphate 4-epimerase [Oscillospiraceae bacterium]